MAKTKTKGEKLGNRVKKMKPGKLSGPSHEKGGNLLEAEGGEYIIKKSSVKKIGKAKLDKINKEGKIPMAKAIVKGKKVNYNPKKKKGIIVKGKRKEQFEAHPQGRGATTSSAKTKGLKKLRGGLKRKSGTNFERQAEYAEYAKVGKVKRLEKRLSKIDRKQSKVLDKSINKEKKKLAKHLNLPSEEDFLSGDQFQDEKDMMKLNKVERFGTHEGLRKGRSSKKYGRLKKKEAKVKKRLNKVRSKRGGGVIGDSIRTYSNGGYVEGK